MLRYFFLLNLVFLAACSPKIRPTSPNPQDAEAHLRVENHVFSVKNEDKFIEEIQQVPLYQNAFIGICVYDLDEKKYVTRYNHDKYFTPASTTKLYTYYAATQLLGDSLPALQYLQKGDSLIIWGTADPTFLHPLFDSQRVIDFLKNTNKKIYFSDANFADNAFGFSWAWDDYESGYAAERSIFPIYGNVVGFSGKPDKSIALQPRFFEKYVKQDPNLPTENWTIKRNQFENQFFYTIKQLKENAYIEVPYRTSGELSSQLLADTLKKSVTYIKRSIGKNESPKIFYNMPVDTVYRRMLQVSDNFLAEHILLMCQQKLENNKKINVEQVIGHLLNSSLKDFSQKPRWVDGSGLSRQNLFTPQNNVELLVKLYEQKKSQEHLFSLLPNGGVSGTIRAYFKAEKPFVFAKTGTLSNNHNLSGYLITKSGKKLAFAYTNNHYTVSTRSIRLQMQKVLTDYYLYY